MNTLLRLMGCAALAVLATGCASINPPPPVDVLPTTLPPVATMPRPAGPATGSLFHAASFRPAFEDQRARLRGRLLGFVFQSFQLLPSLTALENVMLPLELAGVAKGSELARTWLERVGLAHRLQHYPKHLSGGEQQRVALARAFAPNPRLIFADEPTGNLDAATGHQIIDLMFAINAERGTTLILVTHDEEIAARCDRRLRMHAGEIAEVVND